MKMLIRTTILLVALAAVVLAQPTQSIVFVNTNPVGSCSNNAALRMNYLTGDISGCVNGSWSVINSASGSGNPGGATGSIQYKINSSTFGGAATITSGGAISTPSTLSVGVGGSIAGAVDFGQGTLPSLGTTSVTLYAPTSVTSYEIGFPGSAGTGFLLGTASGTNVPLSFVGFLGTGSVLRASATGGGNQCAQFDNSGVLTGTGSACGAGSGTLSYQGSATATALLVAFDTTHIQTPSATTTLDSGGNFSTQGGLSVGVGGSSAGRLALTQGTAPSVGTTNVTIYAPTSVTSYTLRLPGAAGTGFVLGTASSSDVVASFVGFLGTGSVLRASVTGGGTQCAQFDNSGIISGTGSACGSGGGGLAYQGTPTATAVVTAFDTTHVQTPSATTTLDSSGNFATAGGASYGVGGSAAGFIGFTQGSAPSVGTTDVTLYAPTSVTSYTLRLPGSAATGVLLGTASGSDVVLSFATVPATIATGTVSLGTTTVNSGTCSSAIDGGTATGVAATDVIVATANADPTGVTGYTPATTGTLYVWAYPTTNHTNFKLCNNTSSAITPGSAVTLNWKVIR